MRHPDPWMRPGAIHVPPDWAPAPPVPTGTTLGNVQQTADEMTEFHERLVDLVSDPDELQAAVRALTDQWIPDFPEPPTEAGRA